MSLEDRIGHYIQSSGEERAHNAGQDPEQGESPDAFDELASALLARQNAGPAAPMPTWMSYQPQRLRSDEPPTWTNLSSLALAKLLPPAAPGALRCVAIEPSASALIRNVADAFDEVRPLEKFEAFHTSVRTSEVRSWLGARQRDHQPVELIASQTGFDQLLAFLGRRGLRFRLPPASRAYLLLDPTLEPVTASGELAAQAAARLALPAGSIRRVLSRPAPATMLVEAQDASEQIEFPLPRWMRAKETSHETIALLDLVSVEKPAFRIEAFQGELVGNRIVLAGC